MPCALNQGPLDEGSRPSLCAGRKLGVGEQALLWPLLQEHPQCPSRVLLDKVAQRQIPRVVRIRHRNRWRAQWPLNRLKGRPRPASCRPPGACGAEVVQATPHLSFAGVHLFAPWLDPHEVFGPVVIQLTHAIAAHKRAQPNDDCALVQHRDQTRRRRFQAWCFAPLLGIETLTGCDTPEHPLPTRRGRGAHRATWGQCLGQRERIDAAETLRPVLVPHQVGAIAYVDGHRIASGSRVPMHQGTSTMLGRIMAGSHAVIPHDEAGHALCVASHPPDIHLSQVLVDACPQVALATGLSVCVIDRAGHAVALARAFAHQDGGLLCMLDDNEHHGLERFEATLEETRKEGTKGESGPWKRPRAEEPRHGVLVEPAEGKLLVSWGPPQVKAALEPTAWPQGYRERSERQENRFTRMIDHGALNPNYGRNKIVGPDRHQQRHTEPREQAREAAQQRVDKKAEARKGHEATGAEADATGHGKRLAQRQRTCAVLDKERKDAHHQHARLAEHAAAFGPPGKRAERDVRTQTIMTMRTRLLENARRAFMVVLLEALQTQVSVAGVLRLLFARRGVRMETASQVISWINTTGLSVQYRYLLAEIVKGLCTMDVRDQGKPIPVRLKDMPP